MRDPAPFPDFSRRHFLAATAAIGASALPMPAFAAEPLLTRPIPHSGERLPMVGIGTAIVDFWKTLA